LTSLADRPTQTEALYAEKDIARIPQEVISETKQTFDCCVDRDGMAFLTEDEKVWNAIMVLKNKAIRMRFVTTVNEGNMPFCRQIMKCGADVFHNERARGNFQIVDGINYLCYITENGVGHIEGRKQLFHTKNKSFVNIQQCLFDNLCDKAIPAKEKIKEIERGIRNDFVDTINEPTEIRKILNEQLMSARDEVLLLFSTTNSFSRAKDSGLLELLRHVPDDVTVKVLIQVADRHQKNTIQQELMKSHEKIQVQYIAKPLQKKIVTLVVDQATSVAIEINDDAKQTFEEASGAAIYSNRELTVSSCLSIFETLWIQSELNKQNKVKQAYFQMFKGVELKEESYSRQWSFEQKEGNKD
jgi:two-component system sensor histidine kinase VicK